MIDYNIDFTCPYGKTKLQQVQSILWDMYIQIADIFDQNGITYFLSYGSMLGALRHNGFIPWDDDFDICVMQDDYDRAIKILQDNLPADKYVVHNKQTDPIYWPKFTKVRLLKSETYCTLWPEDNKFKYKGVCLDIYRCWSAQYTKYTRRRDASYRAFLWHKDGVMSKPVFLKKFIRSILGMIYHLLKYLIYGIMDMLSPKSQVFVRDPEEIVPPFNKDWLFPIKKVEFNGRCCPIPQNADAILSSQYGNWRQWPTPEQRVPHYSTVKIWEDEYAK